MKSNLKSLFFIGPSLYDVKKFIRSFSAAEVVKIPGGKSTFVNHNWSLYFSPSWLIGLSHKRMAIFTQTANQ
jgi:hypothetical protein